MQWKLDILPPRFFFPRRGHIRVVNEHGACIYEGNDFQFAMHLRELVSQMPPEFFVNGGRLVLEVTEDTDAQNQA